MIFGCVCVMSGYVECVGGSGEWRTCHVRWVTMSPQQLFAGIYSCCICFAYCCTITVPSKLLVVFDAHLCRIRQLFGMLLCINMCSQLFVCITLQVVALHYKLIASALRTLPYKYCTAKIACYVQCTFMHNLAIVRYVTSQ